MQQDILINWSPQETRVAVIEHGAVQELHIERPLERGLVGNVYLGRISRVLPGMQSAFIDIGLERAAFLHVADVWQRQPDGEAPALARKGEPQRPIEKQVFEGQALMVQVIKDPIGNKGARLSTQISIAGRLLVFLPQDEHVGVSQKIPGAERDALRARLQALVGDRSTGGGGGFILRTNGEDSSDAELAEDIAYLRKTWARIRQAALRLPAMSLLHQDLDLLQRVLRDLVGEHTQGIRIDSLEQFQRLRMFGQEFMPAAAGKLQHYKGERPIFDLYSIDEEIAKALGRRVDLKSGGYLIVDQTEALTTIDVNTGGFVGVRNFDDTVFKTNLEAAGAIARQLRLRNLGGVIIVDFIDMAQSAHQEAVLAEFRRQLVRDRVKTMAGGFSQLGLVEMTRKRTRESLAHMLCEPCPACQGKGSVKTARSLCYDILREILREARQFNPREFRVLASAQVVELFLDEESQHLAGLSDFIGKPISLQAGSALGQEQYDIVLL
ncbi:ribonuclease G [Verminephrobacter aporrectodeae]|uniref:ribonuclease G n=1 Tax=Verminephrobacter aporrectodeae TaxID=1110389 RepID=UPI0022378D3E|nr:ribonuclease G [Verminephrobacter aporrectodeae]MCW5221653.1 ribonuclease G [Verminephrobacter aporrectodeae subsp. tuberculatae]MCW5257967.1 ribonuclease G [Verminephrobacter aporrectodeae subsp. tuberculatae]MCW5290943.1 ribonuclease G [Verminephrobacter aporrectodeae subsp. tuberculatae]MCW8176122.1 ribonuclease G [Verminephrobacter aporrectodeae subsp. tuberculatae]MCW8198963.1 ribonuclease G [Verminephrobacter aporrectodeae subsp. tuberculatae]